MSEPAGNAADCLEAKKDSQRMTIARHEDPAHVAAYEVRRRRGFEALGLLGALVFVGLGAWMMVAEDTGVVEKAAGALGIAFFGWAAIIIVQMMRRGGATVVLRRDGVECAIVPPYRTRKFIPWRDVQSVGISRVDRQKFNFVRLARVDDLVRQFSDAEAAQMLKVFRRTMGFAGAAVIVTGANLDFDKGADTAELTKGGDAVASLAGVFRFNRQNFGGEICLSWPFRDRNAERFHELLTAWKDYARTQSGG
jgi:hypothetical protein